jgi:dTDP-L-rhamnose 4-epimerase
MKVLVVGGAGFIGSHLVDALVTYGHDVLIFDSLVSQVHGFQGVKPDYLNPNAKLFIGDVRDYETLKRCLLTEQVEVIFYEAAVVGVGQSMYKIRHYVEVNSLGAATLIDILANTNHNVKKIVVASSMSVYGEGKYYSANQGIIYPEPRSVKQLELKNWTVRDPVFDSELRALPTDEQKPLHPLSIYAITKKNQEELFLGFGKAYRIPTIALRYFNTFGSRQSLSNPYTGVIAIFASRLLNNKPPLIFEDGLQSRDFVHVSDVVQANLLAMENDAADYEVFNVGTGVSISVVDLARMLANKLNKDIQPSILEKYRVGDIRCCYADISKIQSLLDFKPAVSLNDGIDTLASWLQDKDAHDKLDIAIEELENRKLTR